MPVYEYVCSDGHVTERVVSIKKNPPKSIKCNERMPDGKAEDGCSFGKHNCCGKAALKKTVYKVGVQGDLPTRGAF